MRVLHVSPHPDDELIGAPATLFALRDAGAEIVNLAVSLGSDAAMAEVRRAELEEACRRAGFALRFGDPAPALRDGAFDLVVGPSPHDRHPAHVRVARQVLAAAPPRWWMWGLWGELARPTTVTGFGEERLREIHHALEAHASQLARNDFRRLVTGRAMAATVLAAEQVFGFGAAGIDAPYAETTCEVVRDGAAWRLGGAGCSTPPTRSRPCRPVSRTRAPGCTLGASLSRNQTTPPIPRPRSPRASAAPSARAPGRSTAANARPARARAT